MTRKPRKRRVITFNIPLKPKAKGRPRAGRNGMYTDKATREYEDAIRKIYLDLGLPKLEGNKFYFHEVIGFEIEDQRLGVFGKIVSINDTSAQALFEVVNGSVEILVPMIDQFLVKIDRENKKVIMNLPEGLVEMYL